MSTIKDPGECSGEHHYFVATDGTVEGVDYVKVYVVVVCTACPESRLVEHTLSKEPGATANPHKKGQ